jgi:hypothetical protein
VQPEKFTLPSVMAIKSNNSDFIVFPSSLCYVLKEIEDMRNDKFGFNDN